MYKRQLLFSDSLDFERATALYDYFKDKAKVAFGIGTFISNDTDCLLYTSLIYYNCAVFTKVPGAE